MSLRAFAVLVLVFLGIASNAPSARADYDAGKRALEAGQPDQAAAQWRAAAKSGDRRSMLALGRLFAQGRGVVQDYVEAHKWFNLAASRGAEAALKERDALAEKMTPAQVARAQEQASAWRPQRAETVTAARPARNAATTSNTPARTQARKTKRPQATQRKQEVAAVGQTKSSARAQGIDRDGCYQTKPGCFSVRGKWEYVSGHKWGYDMYYTNNCRNRVFAKLCFNAIYYRKKCFEHGFGIKEKNISISAKTKNQPNNMKHVWSARLIPPTIHFAPKNGPTIQVLLGTIRRTSVNCCRMHTAQASGYAAKAPSRLAPTLEYVRRRRSC